VKCPKCGFISFDDLTECKRCGLQFFKNERRSAKDKQMAAQGKGALQAADHVNRPEHIDKTIQTIKRDFDEIDKLHYDKSDDSGIRSEDAGAITVQPSETDCCPENMSKNAFGGFYLRFLAYAIDSVVLGIIFMIVLCAMVLIKNPLSLNPEDIIYMLNSVAVPFFIGNTVIEAFYFVYFHAASGQTLGKLICGIKVVGSDGTRIGYKKAGMRFVGYILSRTFFYLGFFWIAFDTRKQGWHDKLAKTYVVKC